MISSHQIHFTQFNSPFWWRREAGIGKHSKHHNKYPTKQQHKPYSSCKAAFLQVFPSPSTTHWRTLQLLFVWGCSQKGFLGFSALCLEDQTHFLSSYFFCPSTSPQSRTFQTSSQPCSAEVFSAELINTCKWIGPVLLIGRKKNKTKPAVLVVFS